VSVHGGLQCARRCSIAKASMASAESAETPKQSQDATGKAIDAVVAQPVLLARVVAFMGTREASKLCE
jgi:hypothetical protein